MKRIKENKAKTLWRELFGIPIGSLVMIKNPQIRHIHVYGGKDDLVWIKSSLFVGRIIAKNEEDLYAISWIAHRPNIFSKTFKEDSCVWLKEDFKVLDLEEE